ncbi:DUF6191 domain-containing protein [Streptomyces sp. NPDC012794]|uniref:DUF6191 domain-containing protein n=1 Tax=Streptomyces sp. NPDC012794 TaxID=3364850 RepID=UPI003677ED80
MAVWLGSLPAFVCLLAVFAVVESVWRWFTGLGLIPWVRRRTGRSLSSIAFDEFTAVVNGNKTAELEQRRVELLRRDDESDGAPPRRSRVNLAGGTACIVLPPGAPSRMPGPDGGRAGRDGPGACGPAGD